MRSRAHGHVRREGEARDTDLVERDAGGTDLPRDIARNAKRSVGVATQAYTKVIDVVKHCPGDGRPWHIRCNIPMVISSCVIFGGEIEPVTMALMFTNAWRLALMLMELDPLLYRFPWPVKLTGSTIDWLND